MMGSQKRLFVCLFSTWSAFCCAQAPPQAKTAQPAAVENVITQIRKSVVFIELKCDRGNTALDVRGTGFFLSYPDARLGKDQAFIYLVTNRHVALCWDENGHPMHVDNIGIRMNRTQPDNGIFSEEITLNSSGNVPWVLPQDESVDLAVLPLAPDHTKFDYVTVPFSILSASDSLSKNGVAEGEPVFFVGFFYQFPGTVRIEPIVRQGTIAMMPYEKIPFVGMPEKLYLADVHAFGGNSGAPAFINLAGYQNGSIITGYKYRLLGVLNGGMLEDENFNLRLTATIQGIGKANSGISTIVPAEYLQEMIEGPSLKQFRNAVVSHLGASSGR